MIAGFWAAHSHLGGPLRPVILLHGSSQDETSLMDFARHVAPRHPRYFPRGREPWETAFTFFRRHPDRSIDMANLAARTDELRVLIDTVQERHALRPVLIGFSSGAITAAAILARHPTSIDGAVLLRPQRPFGNAPLPQLGGAPVLLLSGRRDTRRRASDAELLLDQLKAAGASAEWHDLPCGHDVDKDGQDMELTRAWLAKRG